MTNKIHTRPDLEAQLSSAIARGDTATEKTVMRLIKELDHGSRPPKGPPADAYKMTHPRR